MEVFQSQNDQSKQVIRQKKLENKVLYGVECKEGYKISGLFSTDPADYINPQYQIGNIQNDM